MTVEVKIGVQHVNRELTVESDESSDALEKKVSEALTDTSGVLALTDTKGRRVVIPVDKLAFVEIGSGNVSAVGFRS